MDPFSIVIGAGNLLDISVRVSKYLLELRDKVASTKDDLESLLQQINSITSASQSIRQAFENEIANSSERKKSKTSEVNKLWQQISVALSKCGQRLGDLEDLLKRITGDRGLDGFISPYGHRQKNTLDNLKLQLRKIPVNHKFVQIQIDLRGYIDTLNLFLNIIGL